MGDKQGGKKRRGLREDNRVQVTLTIGYRPDGKPDRKSFYGKTRSEAMRKKQAYIDGQKRGTVPKDLTVSEWVEVYKSHYRVNVHEAYLRNDDVPYDRLCKAIGRMYLSDVCEADLQKCLNAVRGMERTTCLTPYHAIRLGSSLNFPRNGSSGSPSKALFNAENNDGGTWERGSVSFHKPPYICLLILRQRISL